MAAVDEEAEKILAAYPPDRLRGRAACLDPKLAQDVERLEIAPIIQKAVVLVSKVWIKLTDVLSASDAESERRHVSEALKPIARPQSGGIEP